MATVTELTLEHEITAARQNAEMYSWPLRRVCSTVFTVTLPAKDRSNFSLYVECDDYPGLPPAWHWCNPETGSRGAPEDIPVGGAFFHDSGVICAPWNRLAYKCVNPDGPHDEWDIGDWKSVEQTGGIRTLAAMLDRIAYELRVSDIRRKG